MGRVQQKITASSFPEYTEPYQIRHLPSKSLKNAFFASVDSSTLPLEELLAKLIAI